MRDTRAGVSSPAALRSDSRVSDREKAAAGAGSSSSGSGGGRSAAPDFSGRTGPPPGDISLNPDRNGIVSRERSFFLIGRAEVFAIPARLSLLPLSTFPRVSFHALALDPAAAHLSTLRTTNLPFLTSAFARRAPSLFLQEVHRIDPTFAVTRELVRADVFTQAFAPPSMSMVRAAVLRFLTLAPRSFVC